METKDLNIYYTQTACGARKKQKKKIKLQDFVVGPQKSSNKFMPYLLFYFLFFNSLDLTTYCLPHIF